MALIVAGADFEHEIDRLIDDIPRGHRRDLRDNRNVIGSGIGPKRVNGQRRTDGNDDPEPALTLYVEEKVPEPDLDSRDILPPEIETPTGRTVRTDVESLDGRPTATSATDTDSGGGSPMRRRRIDPMPGGVSIAHPSVRGGTASALLHTADGTPVILSAAHLFSESGASGGDLVGEPANQPSPWHSRSSEQIGTVIAASNYHARSTRPTTSDAVLIGVDEADVLAQYLGYRDADATGRTRFDQRVLTFSSNAGVISGLLTARDVEVTISYPWGDTLTLSGLESYEDVTGAGGSGSVVGHIDPDTGEFTLTGMNIAGSPRRSHLVPWRNIENELGDLRPPAQVDESEQ